MGDSERDGPVGPCPSNLTRKARRGLARFHQEIKKPPALNAIKIALSAGGFFIVLAEAVSVISPYEKFTDFSFTHLCVHL